MDRFPMAVYRMPGALPIHGGLFAMQIVGDEGALQAALSDGWHLTTPEAQAAHEAPAAQPEDDSPPTRAELEAKAAELGIKFDGRWGDKRLGEAIAAAIKA